MKGSTAPLSTSAFVDRSPPSQALGGNEGYPTRPVRAETWLGLSYDSTV
jgi:hypothetical protein